MLRLFQGPHLTFIIYKRNEVLSLYQRAQGTLDRKEHLVHHGDLICKNIEDCTDALSMHM